MTTTPLSDKHARRTDFLPDDQEDRFWRVLNSLLEEHPDPSAEPTRPVVLVAGPPRSGTTFLAQSLCEYLLSSHVDNAAARFWLAPVLGLRLSGRLFSGEQEGTFQSTFGRTSNADIHGFHYFWIHHLRLGEASALFEDPDARGVDPGPIRAHLAAMQEVSARPLVMKGYYPAYFMDWFCRHIPGSMFVLIRRSPLDEARSIYRARQAYLQSVRDWWSMQPPEFDDLHSLPPEEQIAGQVFGLRRMYARQLAGNRVRATWLQYERFMEDPGHHLQQIHQEIGRQTGMELGCRESLPTVRPGQRKPLDTEVEQNLQNALEHYASWDEPWQKSLP